MNNDQTDKTLFEEYVDAIAEKRYLSILISELEEFIEDKRFSGVIGDDVIFIEDIQNWIAERK